jgi:hypothetical protein
MGLGFLYSFSEASELYILIQALIGEFTITNIKDIKWNTLAFKSLTIKENKKMVL